MASQSNARAGKSPQVPKTTYEQAQEALQQGDLVEARRLLIRLLKRDPKNVQYWLLLAAATTNPKEREDSLRQALRLDPDNPLARRGLAFFAEEEDLVGEPVAVNRRPEWEQRYRWQRPTAGGHLSIRATLLALAGLTVVVGLLFGGYALWQKIRPKHLGTPPPAITPSATATPRPTATPPPYTPTPQPLWMLLDATYTPTPAFVDTPRPYEAYRRALRALSREQWADAVRYFSQLVEQEPAADLYFYLGLAYTGLGNYDAARQAFDQALQLDPDFGPAYRGRAWATMQQWPTQDKAPSAADFAQVEVDLQKALALAAADPETYRAALEYWLVWRQNPEQAEPLLDQAEAQFPDRPALWLYYRALLAYMAGDLDTAAQAIEQALDADLTNLPAYLWAARIAFAQGDADTALERINLYRRYRPDDEQALLLYARLHLTHPEGDPRAAVEALERLRTHPSPLVQRERYVLLGRAYLRLGQYDEALRYLEQADEWEQSFETAMLVAEAERGLEHYGNAFLKYRDAVERAETEQQRLTARYWRAKMLMRLDKADAARNDWLAVYNAPADLVPWAWRVEAAQALDMPTPEPPTPTPTVTPTPQD